MSREDDRDRFSRGGFAPIPHRHSEYAPPPPPPPAQGGDYGRDGRDGRDDYRHVPPPRDYSREYPPHHPPPPREYREREFDERRRAPPPWEEEYGEWGWGEKGASEAETEFRRGSQRGPASLQPDRGLETLL